MMLCGLRKPIIWFSLKLGVESSKSEVLSPKSIVLIIQKTMHTRLKTSDLRLTTTN